MTHPPAFAEQPADGVTRRATAVGVGFLVLMLAWQVGARLVSLVWEPPLGPVIAMTLAIIVSIAATVAVARRLRRSQRRAAPE